LRSYATSSPVSTGVGDYTSGGYLRPLSLADPPYMESTGDGFGHHWERNGEFFIAVGLAIAGWLSC